VLVKVPAIADNHKGYFKSLEAHFKHPNWDESGSDVSRFCFESYDPEIYINYESSIWTELEEPELEDIGVFEPVIPLTSSNQIIQRLLEWWGKKYGANKGSRNNNLYKLAAAFNDFGISKTDAEHECYKFTSDGFSRKEIESVVKSAYKKLSANKFFEDYETKERVENKLGQVKQKKKLRLHLKALTLVG